MTTPKCDKPATDHPNLPKRKNEEEVSVQMVFSIQRFIEDYLVRLRLDGTDQYSVRVANLYEDRRCQFEYDEFLERVGRVRTVVFRNRPEIERWNVEEKLVKALDRRFKGKSNNSQQAAQGNQAKETT